MSPCEQGPRGLQVLQAHALETLSVPAGLQLSAQKLTYFCCFYKPLYASLAYMPFHMPFPGFRNYKGSKSKLSFTERQFKCPNETIVNLRN